MYGIMTDPLRMVFEYCNYGDLHDLLRTHHQSLSWPLKINLLLGIAKCVSSHLLNHKFILTLARRFILALGDWLIFIHNPHLFYIVICILEIYFFVDQAMQDRELVNTLIKSPPKSET